MKHKRFILSLAAVSVLTVSARPVMSPLFTDNMVIQQQTDAPIWGQAKAGKTVTVTASWDGKTVSTTSDAQGKWRTTLKTPAAGGPYTITISDGQKLVLNNVMVGEVWLCSGQSNMEMPIDGWTRVYNYEEEKAEANQYPNIRLLQVKQRVATQPSDNLEVAEDGWQVCSAQSVKEFSATGYFFGRDLHKYRNVPIGLINSSWGGTYIEPWTSSDYLSTHPDMKEATNLVNSIPSDAAEREAYYAKKLGEWQEKETAYDPGYKDGKALWAAPDFDDSSWKTITLPKEWSDMGLGNYDGAMWYRHEIDIPSDMAGKDLLLSLGQVDDIDYTYFNGEMVGKIFEFGRDRNYIIPARLVKKGRNVIAVRVVDNVGGGGIYSDASKLAIGTFKKPAKGKSTPTMVKTISLANEWRYKVTTPYSKMPPIPNQRPNEPNQVTVLYNAMIHPMVGFAIRGAIWYQGCNNEHKGYQYRELLPLLIRDWRNKWGYDFPFYIVQLANFRQLQTEPGDDEWAEVREAQAMASQHVENSGMACLIDIGDARDIHPRNKQEVGRRLALVARAKTYGEQQLEYSGPVYRDYRIEGEKIRIYFDHAEGLHPSEGSEVKGFAIAGSDHKWHWAEARIDGNSVVVTSPDVKHPVAVRYAWHVNPICNLQNGAGLPAVPFRTDDWPGLSINNHRAN